MGVVIEESYVQVCVSLGLRERIPTNGLSGLWENIVIFSGQFITILQFVNQTEFFQEKNR